MRYQPVSKVHAALIPGEKDSWKIVDMGSTNGTKLNEHILSNNIEIEIKSGDIVFFGPLSFRFMTWNDFHQLLTRIDT